jgi:hypothetical protein
VEETVMFNFKSVGVYLMKQLSTRVHVPQQRSREITVEESQVVSGGVRDATQNAADKLK